MNKILLTVFTGVLMGCANAPHYDTYPKPTIEYTSANGEGLLEQEQRWHLSTYRHLRARMYKVNQ